MSSVLYPSLHSPIWVDHGPLSWFCFEKPRSQAAFPSIKTRPHAARKNRSGYFAQSCASHSNFFHISRHAMWQIFHNCDVRNDCHCAWAAGAAAALVIFVVIVVVVGHRTSLLRDVVVLLIGGGRLISGTCRNRARVGLSARGGSLLLRFSRIGVGRRRRVARPPLLLLLVRLSAGRSRARGRLSAIVHRPRRAGLIAHEQGTSTTASVQPPYLSNYTTIRSSWL